MTSNTISIYTHERMISQLYSLVGPQANLPTILMETLGNNSEIITKKLAGEMNFSNEDLVKIREKFHNAVLHLSMSA